MFALAEIKQEKVSAMGHKNLITRAVSLASFISGKSLEESGREITAADFARQVRARNPPK